MPLSLLVLNHWVILSAINNSQHISFYTFIFSDLIYASFPNSTLSISYSYFSLILLSFLHVPIYNTGRVSSMDCYYYPPPRLQGNFITSTIFNILSRFSIWYRINCQFPFKLHTMWKKSDLRVMHSVSLQVFPICDRLRVKSNHI